MVARRELRRVLVWLAGLAVLAATLTEPAAAARRSTVTNVSSAAVRICLTATSCSTSGKLLGPGQNSRQVLGTKKIRALHVPKGSRAVVTTRGKRAFYSGPVTVRLPACQCRRTVQLIQPKSTKLGPSRSGLPWLSGVWTGGRFSPSAVAAYGEWRGRPIDIVTAYSRRDSYRAIASETWSIGVWNGVPGRLSYGLAILPDSGEGSLASVASGKQDWVWRAVANNLKSAGRGNSVVRIAWEANIPRLALGLDRGECAGIPSGVPPGRPNPEEGCPRPSYRLRHQLRPRVARLVGPDCSVDQALPWRRRGRCHPLRRVRLVDDASPGRTRPR